MTDTNQSLPAVQHDSNLSWGRISRGFCIFGGVVVVLAGINLAALQARSDNNMLEAIANGLGYYFIGKGIFMIAMSLHAKEAIKALLRNGSLRP